MSAWRQIRADIDERERGMALIMTIGIAVLLAGLVVAAVAYATGAARQSQRDEGWNAALAAAYAGVDEYASRLANELGYFRYGNPAAPFSATSTSIRALPADRPNPAFGIGVSGTWATVPGSGGSAQFRYEVDNSTYIADGTLRLRATGRAGGETRTVVADLKQRGFIDYLYFTDFEVSDPQASNPLSTVNCAIYHYSAASRSHCNPINFGGADVIRGPLHTNDAMRINGPARFEGTVTTSYRNSAPGGRNYVQTEGSAPTFARTGDPAFEPKLPMPATNAQIKKETRSDLPDEVPSPGCLYTGPTSITFHSNGTMTVISPWTKATNTSGENSTAGTSPTKCGVPGSTAGTLGARTAAGVFVGQSNIPVPENFVAYVQNVPGVDGNVNRTLGNNTPHGNIACPSNGGNHLGYPMANETIPFSTAYGCKNGDIFVRGDLKGRATLASENYIYVTGDIRYTDAGDDGDMLGLVGNNAVWVHNPMRHTDTETNRTRTQRNTRVGQGWQCVQTSGNVSSGTDRYECKRWEILGGSASRRIDAAVLSVAHTFMVQNYDKGISNRGTLTVFGAIAQKYRGPVGTGNGSTMTTGYGKDYRYDDRLRQTAPPKFLTPVTTTYGVSVLIEVEPAFAADGSVR